MPSVGSSHSLREDVCVCVDDVASWMRSNRLQLNTTKTEVLWCATSRRQHQIPQEATRVGNHFVQTAGWLRDLGIYLDSEASMKIHVSRTVSSCFTLLRQVYSAIRHASSRFSTSLVVSLVLSRLHYGNATLTGLPGRQLNRLHRLQSLNAAARLIFAASKYDQRSLATSFCSVHCQTKAFVSRRPFCEFGNGAQ